MSIRFLLVIVVGSVALVHSPGLDSGFHYDDGHSLLRNPHIRSLANAGEFFTHPSTFSETPEYAMYRPLVLLTYAVNYALAERDPVGYHLLNLLLHCGVTLTAYLLARQFGVHSRESLLVALAFGLHPIATEPVSYVSSRSELLAGLFYGLSVVGFARFRFARSHNYAWHVGSLGAFCAALLSKAVALSLPLMLLLLEALAFRPHLSSGEPGRNRTIPLVAHVPFWVVSLLYVLLYRGLVPGSLERTEQLRDWTTQLATQAKAFVHYIQLGVVPVKLNVHQQFFESPTLFHPAPFSALLVGLSLLWVAIRFRHAVPTLSLSCGWFFFILLPTFAVPLHILVNDHRLYLSTFALSLAVAILTVRRYRPAFWLWCLFLGIISWQRHEDWANELTLWSDAVAKAPLMPEAHYNLGHAHHLAGTLNRARSAYEEAVRLSPMYARAQSNLGALYRETGENELAVAALRRALVAEPNLVEAMNNLGLMLAARSRYSDAIEQYRQALEHRPHQAEIWMNLGLALRDNGQMEGARTALQRAAQLDPKIKRRFPVVERGKE